MKINEAQEAHDALADVLWWMRGYAAATSDHVAHGMVDKLLNIQQWIDAVKWAGIRRLGDETAIVVKFSEWEKICDFLIQQQRPTELEIAMGVARQVHGEYRKEAEQASEQARQARISSENGDLPF